MKQYWSAVWIIIKKDLRLEWHTGHIMAIMVLFGITTIVLYNLALSYKLDAARNLSMGLFWVTTVLTLILGLNRSLNNEIEQGGMNGTLLTPINRTAIYLGKVGSMLIFALILEAILIPLFSIAFNQAFWRFEIIGVIFLGILGYVALGVLITAISIQTRARDVLLPVLLLPLSLPAILAAATASAAFLESTQPDMGDIQLSLTILFSFDIIMLTIGFLTYQFVIED